MKVFVRHLGNIVAEAELEEGREYLLGRSPEADIQVAQDFVSRRHARIYFSEGAWVYEEMREKKDPEKPSLRLDDHSPIRIEKGLELVTTGYLSHQNTREVDARDELHGKARHALMVRRPYLIPLATVALVAVLATIGYFVYRQWYQPMNATDLLAFVRPKIVEFEDAPDPEIVRQLKEFGKFQDDDFRKNVGFCSGFLVAKNVVLTASHCVLGPFATDIQKDFSIKTNDQKSHKATRVLGFDIQRDYLYLEVPGLEGYGHLEFEAKYKIGETVYTLGNVLGQGIAIREGITASKTKDESDPSLEFLRYSAATSPGNSGGPLVNARGKVVGLVFARSGLSENYNIATDSRDLLEGLARFAGDREKKKVVISLDKIPSIVRHDLFGLFAPEPSSGNPGDSEAKKEKVIEVEVPATIAEIAETITPSMDKFMEESLAAGKALSLFGEKPVAEVKAEWAAQATEETPLVLPYPQYDRLNVVRTGPDYFVSDIFSVFEPADGYTYDVFKAYQKDQKQYVYQARQDLGYLEGKDEEKSAVRYESRPRNEKRVLDSFGLDLSAFLDYGRSGNWEEIRSLSDKERKEVVLGEKGISIFSFYNRFLKPDRARSFVLSDLPPPEISETKDAESRTWTTARWKMFKDLTITQSCLPLPEGYFCLLKGGDASLPSFFQGLSAGALDEKLLSQVMVAPAFWRLPALIDYKTRGYGKNLHALEDVQIEETSGGDLTIRFVTLGVAFQIPASEKPKMIRIIPALYHHQGQGRWIAVGYSGYFPQGTNEAKFCGADVLLAGIAPYADSIQRLSALPGEKPLENVKYTAKSLGKEATVVPFCQGISKEGPYYRFGAHKPYSVGVTLF